MLKAQEDEAVCHHVRVELLLHSLCTPGGTPQPTPLTVWVLHNVAGIQEHPSNTQHRDVM